MRQNGNLGFSLFHDDAFPFSNYPLSPIETAMPNIST